MAKTATGKRGYVFTDAQVEGWVDGWRGGCLHGLMDPYESLLHRIAASIGHVSVRALRRNQFYVVF